MGLAVLPARLKEEMELLEAYILEGKDISSNEKIEKHAAWAAEFLPKYDSVTKENIHEILQKEIGMVFIHVLEDAGVYDRDSDGYLDISSGRPDGGYGRKKKKGKKKKVFLKLQVKI